MQQLTYEFPAFTRVDLLGSAPFTCWAVNEDGEELLLGPYQAHTRRCAVVIPQDYVGLLVRTDGDIRILSAISSDSRETPDQTRLVVDEQPMEADSPLRDVVSLIRAEFARLGWKTPNASQSDSEAVSDDDPWDDDDPTVDEPFAMIGVPTVTMEPDIPDEMTDEKVTEQLDHAEAKKEEAISIEANLDPAGAAPAES